MSPVSGEALYLWLSPCPRLGLCSESVHVALVNSLSAESTGVYEKKC